ncbi:PREDICTED: root meristem growth factor 5 [Tarenaya hassleriana]|uniref:root meristem growth factor 5 n=1 Tax=Tarenaya hassleriana TaxID=28532 RepID=UPI00053C4A47|nr:PREDICTED: root meristem growth factor 5 [Tarenaya hassleriana]
MSSVHAASFLVMFLFIHACDSRHVGIFDHVSIAGFRFQTQSKDLPKASSVRVTEKAGENHFKGSPVQDSIEEGSRIVQRKSMARVSQRVKHDHQPHPHPPEFYADYPKPSTRPPRHN